MMKNPSGRKVILYIACSIDGFIAKPGDDLSFLDLVREEGQDYGYGAFIQTVDTVILGKRTYDWVNSVVPEFPHADKRTFVITRSYQPHIGKVHFYTGNLRVLLEQLKSEEGKHIFLDGGAEVVHLMLADDLIDEIILSTIPVSLGSGIRLFREGSPEYRWELVSVQSFPKGLVQTCYRRSR